MVTTRAALSPSARWPALVLPFLSLVACAALPPESFPVVRLEQGEYQASALDPATDVFTFSSIRYAAPPTGNLRFAPPSPPQANDTSTADGPEPRICPQATANWLLRSAGWLPAYISTGAIPDVEYSLDQENVAAPSPRDDRETEDCLFLDVHVPKSVLERTSACTPKVPVFVHIHGGGYTSGSKHDDDPRGLFARAKQQHGSEFIWVSINYRLGALGFLAGPAFEQAGGSPNLGLLDQRLALRWVRDNIHLFGGDSNKVTASGGSAGAGSIIHQITAYGGSAGNDFQKAIIDAPAVGTFDSPGSLDAAWANFLTLAGVSSLDEARGLTSDQIISANAAQVAGAGYGSFIYGPVIDGSLVPLDPKVALASGLRDPRVEVLVGHNQDEGYGFAPPTRNESEFEAYIAFRFPNATQDVLDHVTREIYPPVFDGSLGYADHVGRAQRAVTEFQFICSANAVADGARASRVYHFDLPPAIHLSDGAYVFRDPTQNATLNATVADFLQDYLVSFALGDVPEAIGGVRVPVYGNASDAVLISPGGITSGRDPAANARCDWWRRGLYN